MPAALVSIGLPVYNGEAYLEDCLNSILGQTYEKLEVIISDNASTDDTSDICRRFMANDRRIQYIRQPSNVGAAKNYNIVFEMANGRYFRWAAHDDLIMPSYLETCVRVLEKDADEKIVIAYTGTVQFDERTKEATPYDVELPWGGATANERLRHCLVDSKVTILNKCFPIFGLMRTDSLRTTQLIQAFNGADGVLLVEMALRGDFERIPEYLFHRRLHEKTSLNACKSKEEVARWFDPVRDKRFPMVNWYLFIGYLRGVRGAPLSFRQKLEGFATIARWCTINRRWRFLLSELRTRIFLDLGIRKPRLTPQQNEYSE